MGHQKGITMSRHRMRPEEPSTIACGAVGQARIRQRRPRRERPCTRRGHRGPRPRSDPMCSLSGNGPSRAPPANRLRDRAEHRKPCQARSDADRARRPHRKLQRRTCGSRNRRQRPRCPRRAPAAPAPPERARDATRISPWIPSSWAFNRPGPVSVIIRKQPKYPQVERARAAGTRRRGRTCAKTPSRPGATESLVSTCADHNGRPGSR